MKDCNWSLAGLQYLSGLLCCLLLCSSAVRADTAVFGQEDPRSCLTAIQRSLEEADAAAFEHLVDVDAILHEALEFILKEMQKPQVAVQVPPVIALLLSQATSESPGQGGVRSLLTGTVRAFVMEGISSGAFGGHETGTTSGGLLTPLFAEASMGRKEICFIGQARPTAKDVDMVPCWLVPFSVHDAGNGETYPVLGRICRQETGFQLTAVENLPELFSQIQQEITRQVE